MRENALNAAKKLLFSQKRLRLNPPVTHTENVDGFESYRSSSAGMLIFLEEKN
jgi:hypothetical protein